MADKNTKKKTQHYRKKLQSNKSQKVDQKTALSNILRPMSAVDLATQGKKPAVDKPMGEQRRTMVKAVNRSEQPKDGMSKAIADLIKKQRVEAGKKVKTRKAADGKVYRLDDPKAPWNKKK